MRVAAIIFLLCLGLGKAGSSDVPIEPEVAFASAVADGCCSEIEGWDCLNPGTGCQEVL